MGRRSTLAVLLCLGAFAVTGCASGTESPSGETPIESDDGSRYLTGSTDDWLSAVCPNAAFKKSDLPPGTRGGPDVRDSPVYCTEVPQDDSQFNHAIELYTYDVDPTAYWEEQQDVGDADNFVYYAIGQVSEQEWVVMYEDDSRYKITDPHIVTLEQFGFEVVIDG